jgi:hypothetical protein
MSKKEYSEESSSVKACDSSSNFDSREKGRFICDETFVCKQCGRSTSKKEELCQPERLYCSW